MLPKPARTRTGDWEAYPLTAEQRDYAALDAYASFRVFSMLAARASPTALGDVTNRAADSVPLGAAGGRDAPGVPAELECKPPRSVVAWRDPVAARPQVGHVQPAKQAAYDDYFLFGKTAEAIAADKSIKIGTVYNYLSEAVDRGLAYDWARFEEDLGGPHVFAAIKAALAAGRSRSDVRKVLDVEWWQISLVQAPRRGGAGGRRRDGGPGGGRRPRGRGRGARGATGVRRVRRRRGELTWPSSRCSSSVGGAARPPPTTHSSSSSSVLLPSQVPCRRGPPPRSRIACPSSETTGRACPGAGAGRAALLLELDDIASHDSARAARPPARP